MMAGRALAKDVTVIRAGASTYWVFFFIWFLVGGPVLLRIVSYGHVSWPLLGVTALYAGFLISWVRAFRIEYGQDWIGYRSLLGGNRRIGMDEISRVEEVVGLKRYTDRLLPTVRLEITPKPGVAVKKIVINLKAFDRNELAKLFEVFERFELW